MRLTIDINNTENIGELSDKEYLKITEIVTALVVSGGLTGVTFGQTIIHFGKDAEFRGVELKYWPYFKRQ